MNKEEKKECRGPLQEGGSMCNRNTGNRAQSNKAEIVIKEVIEENYPELKNEVGLQMKKAHRVS